MKTPSSVKAFSTFSKIFAAFLVMALFPNPASAHILPGDAQHGLSGGFAHPFLGFDHLLAMLAVGLWAMQQKGNARWLIPLSFVGVMAIGGSVGIMNLHIPLVEFFIAGSLLVLGILVATSAKFLPIFSMALVGFFAFFHGYSHGSEMPLSTNALSFSIGFIVATLLLHGLGMAVGFHLQKNHKPVFVRFAGAAISLCSLYFFIH